VHKKRVAVRIPPLFMDPAAFFTELNRRTVKNQVNQTTNNSTMRGVRIGTKTLKNRRS